MRPCPSLTRTRLPLTPHHHPSPPRWNHPAIVHLRAIRQPSHPALDPLFQHLGSSRPTPHRHQHPRDCPALIRAFHARPTASLRLSGASRASPKRSRPPPHLRPGPPPHPCPSPLGIPVAGLGVPPFSRLPIGPDESHRPSNVIALQPDTRIATLPPPCRGLGPRCCGRTSRPVAQRAEATHARRQLPGFESSAIPTSTDGAGSGHGRHARR